MKLYLGNAQDIELEVDEEDIINLYPTAGARGGYSDAKTRDAYLANVWDGINRGMKYFYYKENSGKIKNMRQPLFKEKKEAEEAAKKYYEDNNKNTIHSIIPIKVKDLTLSIITNFRYIQPIVDYEVQEVIIDPFWVGCWLGDGSINSTGITNIDKVIIDYIYKHAVDNNMIVTVRGGDEFCTIKGPTMKGKYNPLLQKMRNLNLIDNKHIPEIYLKNSREIRLQVLAGLLDTDGHLTRNYYEITQKSVKLAEDIVMLANSLGFFTRMVDKIGYAANTINQTRRNYKRISIYITHDTFEIPVLIERKKFDKEKLKNLNGIKISLEKTKTKHINAWTDKMKDKFEETRDKYIVKNKVMWKEMVKNEELYKNSSSEALRAYNTGLKKVNKS
jgi:hypothetical protein